MGERGRGGRGPGYYDLEQSPLSWWRVCVNMYVCACAYVYLRLRMLMPTLFLRRGAAHANDSMVGAHPRVLITPLETDKHGWDRGRPVCRYGVKLFICKRWKY